MKKILIISLISVLAGVKTWGQDIHFSQYDASPVIINPAYTGMYDNAKYRVTNQYRNQWDAVARKSYMSSIITYDMPYKEKWGMGAYLINDNSARVYNSFSFVASGAHNITIDDNNKHFLTAGLQLGIIYKRTNIDNYLFDNQYNEGYFDPDLPSGENFEYSSRILPEINLGVAYRYNEKMKTALPYGGISFFHLLNPKDNITANSESRLPLKYVFHGGCIVTVSDKVVLDPKVLVMMQRNVFEINIGATGIFQLNETDFNLIGGLNYRWNDAVISSFGLYYKNIIYKVSYDFNVSELREFSNFKGGLEFSIVFMKMSKLNTGLL